MATNKIYEVERVEINSRLSDTVYSGRIRDCKKSLTNIEKAYKERGFITLNKGFTLFIYTDTTPKVHWAYVIKETK